MSELFINDTETTGIPEWKIPSGDPAQPHIVQLAALRVDEDTKKVKQTLDVIIKPEGFEITPDMTEIHGITHEYAMDVGVPERLALEMFLAMWEGCSKRIAYNTTFDNRIIRIGTKRYFDEGVIDAWKAGEYECAMILAKKAMGASKNQKLEVAYKHFTGRDLENAHSALADTNAAMEVYWLAKAALAEKESE